MEERKAKTFPWHVAKEEASRPAWNKYVSWQVKILGVSKDTLFRLKLFLN